MLRGSKNYTLSATQKGIYFDSQVMNSTAYNLSAVFELSNINEYYFEMALKLLIAEQKIFHARIDIVNSIPSLVIQDQHEGKLEKIDLSNDKTSQPEKIKMYVKQDNSTVFDLHKSPLYSIKLIKLEDTKYLFLFNIHHIISDGLSFNIIIKKILAYHNMLLNNQPISINEDFGFIKYVEKENDKLTSGKINQQKHFWLDKLKDIQSVNFPVDHIVENKNGIGKEKRFAIKKDISDSVKRIISDLEVTEYMFYLTLFAIMVFKYTRKNEVILCTPISYRPNFDLLETVGCFINTLLLPINIENEDTFLLLVKKVLKVTIDGFKNIEYPNNLIMREVSNDFSSIFDLMFVQDIYEEISEGRLTANIIAQDSVTFPGNMMIIHNKTSNGDYIKIQYKEEMFEEQTIEFLGQRFLKLLELVVLDVNVAIDKMDLILNVSMPHQTKSTNNLSQDQGNIESIIIEIWEETLGVKGIKLDDNFFDIGGNSFALVEVNNKLKNNNLDVSIKMQFQCPTIRLLAKYFCNGNDKPLELNREITSSKSQCKINTSLNRQDIAIIGLSINVPGAQLVNDFWGNLKNQRETIHYYTDKELLELGIPIETINSSKYVKACGCVDGVEYFDPEFFDFPPASVTLMSPQYRLLYPGLWRAFEDAGYYPNSNIATIGLYLSGSDDFDWYKDYIIDQDDYSRKYQAFTLGTNHFLATHVAYKLDLKGPAFTTLSGCSSALLSVHLACQGLKLHECDIAVAGGITFELPNKGGYFYEPGMMFSPDGHCRPFDDKAAGTFFSSGMGLVVLKRLEEALKDGDNIYAVIKGSAVNNDGAYKLGFTAPSAEGQADAIRKAYHIADIIPETVTYVEAHGTGTSLGDPIEVESLINAFSSQKKQFCTLSSVKGNIGHTDTAAGAVSLVKVALSMKNKFIPGTVNYEVPNSKIDFENSPFIVSSNGKPWEINVSDTPRRAGINCFGVGGTNVHMVLEESPSKNESSLALSSNLLVFSAKTRSALNNTAKSILEHLRNTPSTNLSDAAWTLQVGRREHPFRKSFVINNTFYDQNEEEVFKNFELESDYEANAPLGSVCFMFSGQGSQYQGMARDLYNSNDSSGVASLFKQHLNDVLSFVPTTKLDDYLGVIFGSASSDLINQTEYSQFALFSIEYALAKVIIDLGIKPNIMLGHSIGELVAATIAGVFQLKDAVEIVIYRARVMQKQPRGVMLAVMKDVSTIKNELKGDIWIALVNTTGSCVVGGTEESIVQFEEHCKQKCYPTIRLKTSHAFHTPMMKSAAEEFSERLKKYKLSKPNVPIISNSSGIMAQNDEITKADYWAQHILNPVQFSSCLSEVQKEKDTVFIEIGPGQILTSFAKKHIDNKPGQRYIHLLRHQNDDTNDVDYINRKIGELWCSGFTIDWSVLRGSACRYRISLPTYVFDQFHFPFSLKFNTQEDNLGKVNQQYEPKQYQISRKKEVNDKKSINDFIADAFKVVLGFDHIKPCQDFFALGGDSLKAINLVAEITSLLNVNIEVKDVFTYPTPDKLSDFIKANIDTSEEIGTIISVPTRSDYPLSSAQKRMYAQYMLDKYNLAYNLPSATIVKGELCFERFKKTLEKLSIRHEALRTYIKNINGMPVQIVSPECIVQLTYSEYQNLNDDNIQNLIDKFVKPFDLEKGPLFRTELIKLAENKYLFLFDIHHIIADGTSMEIISRDFNQLYFGELTPLLIQYKDFAVSQLDYLKSDMFFKQKSFWTDYLDGELPILDFPFDYERPNIKQLNGERVYFSIEKQITEKLGILTQQTSTTKFMVLLAVWNVLLARYTNQDDIIVGVPVSGRTQRALSEMVGMFVNMLPVRTKLCFKQRFADFLIDVKNNVLNVFNNQDCPFDEIVQVLNTKRDLSRNAIFDVCFDFQNMPFYDLKVDNLEFSSYQFETKVSPYDLVLTCQEDNKHGKISAFIDFSTSLFKKETIERLIANLQLILEKIVNEKKVTLEDIDIIADEEKKLYEKFNNTELILDQNYPIQEIFAQNVQKTPEKVAVITSEDKHLSYFELNSKSTSLAHTLLTLNNTPNKIIGIIADRNEYLFIAMFAVLKARKAFLLIDPTLPKDRIDYMIAKCSSNIILNATSLIDVSYYQGNLISLGSYDYSMNKANYHLNGLTTDLAYLIFTSGTTGKPKGVLVNQSSVVNFIHDIKNRNIFTQNNDVMISLATVCFDIFIFETIVSLCLGNTVYLASEVEQLDPAMANKKIIQHKITHILGTISRIKSFTENMEFKHALSQLKCILTGGEIFPIQLLRDLKSQSKARIYNMYGPTETTIWSTTKELSQINAINIGCPIANTQVYIINNAYKLQPIGVWGEICIAGEGLATGYLDKLNESEDKFIQIYNGVLVYRTGDRGRFLANGDLEIKGRIDAQVKVRGYRIELTEIENVILENQRVNLVAAVTFDDKSYNKQIAVYYTLKKEHEYFSESELRNWLKTKLPNYMLPMHIECLDVMPVLLSGKINRNELPLPELMDSEIRHKVAKDESLFNIEQTLLSLWQDVLNVDEVSIYDNFFDLGGNSLGLIYVNNKLSEILEYSVPLTQFFEYPTIDAFVKNLTGCQNNKQQNHQVFDKAVIDTKTSDIAVIGIAGKFPGADNVMQLWENLVNGVESITKFDDNALLSSGIDADLLSNSNYVKSKGYLLNSEYFDAEFFGYTNKEANIMDPQARILHQCVWEVLENAGYDPFTYESAIGLFAGSSSNTLWSANLIKEHQDILNVFEAVTFNEKDFLTTRLSYKLDLKGPSYNIQTACSTSLVSIHQAIQSLLNGDCQMAIAGGVSITFPVKEGYLWHEGLIFSRDGHCRPFDKDATGIVPGNGCGLVLLKPLSAALQDGDHVYAVIKGSAVNNDGIAKVGYTAPGMNGQKGVIKKALEKSEIHPDQINYVEAHGTGTSLGDPIEVAALKSTWATNKKNFCAIGSIKANLGHLDSAAGVAGFIKAVMILHKRVIPPLANFTSINPMIDLDNSPFYINSEAKFIADEKQVLRAAVSSFGIGGTNAHLILEQAHINSSPMGESEINILPFSAKKTSALIDISKETIEYLQDNSELNFSDVAWTLQVGRHPFEYRKVIITSGKLSNHDQKSLSKFVQNEGIKSFHKKKKMIFLFPNNNSLLREVALYLYQLAEKSRISELYKYHINETICLLCKEDKEIIHSILLTNDISKNEEERKKETQLFLFISHYALTKSFIEIGLIPDAVVGEGIGELVALVVANIVTFKNAIELVKTHFLKISTINTPSITEYIINKNTLDVSNEELKQTLDKFNFKKSSIPILSSKEKTGFTKEIKSFTSQKDVVFIEVGTGKWTKSVLNDLCTENETHETISLFNSENDGYKNILHINKIIGELWCCGFDINWKKLNGNIPRKRVPLPTYQFVKEYHNSNIIERKNVSREYRVLNEVNNVFPESRKSMEKLRKIWCEHFDSQDIQNEDDFFKLGGDSLGAIAFASKIQKEFGIDMSLSLVFKNSTFEKMLAWVMSSLNFSSTVNIRSLGHQPFYETSYAQKRMYIVQELLGKSSLAYNLAAVYKISGNVNKEKFKYVFDSLVKRHEVFRTRFIIENGVVVQTVEDKVDSVVEFETYFGNELQNRIKSFIRPFDLSKAPLLRVKLIDLSNNDYILIIDTHHIVIDQVSISILLDEINELYLGKELFPHKIDYKDFAAWQNEFLNSDMIKRQIEYWKQEFSGSIPRLELPLDFPRKKLRELNGHRIAFEINQKLSEKIDNLIRENALTPFMVFVAALNLLLWKYSGQNDIVIGTATSGRNHSDILNMVGMFANTLALRTQIDSKTEILKYLEYIKSKVVKAYENQDCQFEMLLEVLNLESNASRNPLFDIVINYIDMKNKNLNFSELVVEPWSDLTVSAKFDICWTIEKTSNGYIGDVEYCCALYNEATIQNMIQYWLRIVEIITINLDKKLCNISLLSDSEKQYLGFELNQTASHYPKEKCIMALFDEQVKKNPLKTAIEYENEKITYAQLDNEIDKVVDLLVSNKVEGGFKIGIMIESSPLQIFCILAVLRCGCIYVPIDSKSPIARINYMLQDSNVFLLLTKSHLVDKKNEFTNLVLLDNDLNYSPITDRKSRSFPYKYKVRSDDPAYIMYTSGSTGMPKGVLVTHRNIVRLVKNTNYIEFKVDDNVLQLSNFAFDGSVFGIFGALLNGASLVLIPDKTIIEITLFSEMLKQTKNSVFFITSALFNILVDYDVLALKNARKIFVGGETLSTSHIRRALKCIGPNKLNNGYGPTETTVFATYYPINALENGLDAIPIGYPISNSKLYVVDEVGQLLPCDFVGELCIGGDGVSLGYLNNNELTKKSFIKSPCGSDEVVYKTGDRVKRLKSGEIIYIGRYDSQVKIRGFRVELSEIESQVKEIAGVKDVKVIVNKDSNGDNRIELYYTVENPDLTSNNTPDELREAMRQALPSYMIPTKISRLASLPMNVNGKVDLNTISLSEKNNLSVNQDSNDKSIKNIIVKCMKEVLDIPFFQASDDFFQSGGHSIKAIALKHKLEKVGINVSVSDIFQNSNATSLSEYYILNKTESVNKLSMNEYKNRTSISLNDKQVEIIVSKIVNCCNTISSIVTSSKEFNDFPMAGVQLLHKTLDGRFSGFCLKTESDLSKEKICQRIAKIILNNQLLHSVVKSELPSLWREYKASSLSTLIEDNIAYDDLTIYEEQTKNLIVDKIFEALVASEYSDDKLPWRCCILNYKQNQYYVIWGIDHLVFDGMSADLLRNQIINALKNDIEFKETLKYQDYVSLLNNGPEKIAENDIIEIFSLPKWSELNAQIGKAIVKSKIKNTNNITLNISLSEYSISDPWEFTFNLIVNLIKRYFKISEIPLGMLSYGRSYCGNDFYNCVGEFIDIIPLISDESKSTSDMISLLNISRNHSINFSSLLYNNTLCNKYQKLNKLLNNAFKSKEKKLDMILFNFQGYVSMEDINRYSIAMKNIQSNEFANFQITANHDRDNLRISITSKLNIKRVNKIIDAYLKNINNIESLKDEFTYV